MRRAALALTVLLWILALAPGARAAPTVYDVVIDGLDAEEVGPATTPNLWALTHSADPADRGTSYEAARAIMPSETNPNHVAMMTGAYTNASGNVGDFFVDRASMAILPDDGPPPAETLFTGIERQRPALATAGIFGKPKLGRIFSTGGSNVAPDYLWIPCGPGDSPPPGATCGTVPVNPITGYAFDVSVMDEVLRVVDQGVDGSPADLVFVNLPDVDSAGHAFTPTLPTYDAAAISADTQLGRLVDRLKETGKWSDSVVIVHADHGMDEGRPTNRITLTSQFTDAGIPADAFVAAGNTGLGGHDNVYLKDPAGPDAQRWLATMRAVANSNPGVRNALYREPNPLDGGDRFTMAAWHPDWHYDSERAGDLIVTAESHFLFSDPSSSSNPLLGNHGHPTTRAIPYVVAGGSRLIKDSGSVAAPGIQDEADDTARFPDQAETVDDAATIAALLGVSPPVSNQGRVLTEAVGRKPRR